MKSGRKEAREALAEHLPAEWQIRDDLRQQDAVSRPTVLLVTGEVSRAENFNYLTWQLTAYLLAPDSFREDRLDECLGEFLQAVEKTRITWQEARRAVVQDSFQGWELQLTLTERN